MATPDPPGSSPPYSDPQELGELPEGPSEQLELPTSSPLARLSQRAQFAFDLTANPISSDELAAPFSQPNSASAARQSRFQNGLKRGPSSSDIDSDIDKEHQNHGNQHQFQNQASNEAKLLIREARSLLLKAINITPSHDQQSRLLDLVEIFREYTEFGRIRHTSTLLASQVANLENATKRIEIQSRTQAKLATQAKTTSGKPTWAKIATQEPQTHSNSHSEKDWTLVSHTKSKNQGGNSPSTLTSGGSARDTKKPPSGSSARDTSTKSKALSRKSTFLLAHMEQASSFSAISTRNLLNTAFRAKGIKGLVISTVSLSSKGNIIVNTTPEFNSDFLVQNEATIKGVLPLVKSIQKGEPWYKVIIHGIPIREFDTPEGMDLVLEEIKIFNKGLEPIGQPYWATSKEKRDSGLQRAGSVVVAFPTEAQANRAIKNRLLIAGISAKVVKYHTISSTAQCTRCAGYGHLDSICKKDPKCLLCGEGHVTENHFCSICKKKGKKCPHVTTKCSNCLSTAHSASSKLCEVYLAIKQATTATTIPTITINE
jgi:hypothetical protein